MVIDKNYFPGWVRKSFTFTIDDGNIALDTKFINIVKPYGIVGTFNLSSPKLESYTPEFYRELYRGYGISNHCKYHPYVLTEDKMQPICDEKFDPATAKRDHLYRTEREGVYRYCIRGEYWGYVAEPEAYCKLADDCLEELNSVFGENSVNTFVWPYCEQKNDKVLDYITSKAGYYAVRKTGSLKDTTNFSLPSDRAHWSYNINHVELLETAETYEKYPDDGELKFFCFGLHSHDYERGNCWYLLEDLCRKYGNRPEDFYYASVEDIFRYEDAVKSLVISEGFVENPTDITLYVKIDGKRIKLPPKFKYTI